MIPRIALAALAVLAPAAPATGTAQHPRTVDDVLQRFAAGEDLNRARNDAGSLLRQERGPATAEEIETLIEGLVELALAPDACTRFRCPGPDNALIALVSAASRPGVYARELEGFGYRTLTADDLPGVPVPEAFDALVRIYETLAARSLAEGGDDPFLEAARRDHARKAPDGHLTTLEQRRLSRSLRSLFNADLAPDGRGWAYVLALFERSKPPCKERDGPPEPPDCAVGPGSAWCMAGSLLHRSNLGMSLRRPWPGPNRDLWERRCKFNGPWNVYADW